MNVEVNLYSTKQGEIYKFLTQFYDKEKIIRKNTLKWAKQFDNPIEIADIIGVFIDNKEKFQINMWISLDKGAFVNVTEDNINSIIKYLYERFPY